MSNLFTRRRLLQLFGSLLVTGAAGIAYSRIIEPNWLDVAQIDLQIPGLPDKLIGKRLAQLSDIHLCEYTNAEPLTAAVALVNQHRPDCLLLTGDFVGDDARHAEGLRGPLRQVQAPMVAVYGNHDYWSDRQIVHANLTAAGVQVLRNEALPLAENLWLAGVDDIWSGRPDLAATLQNIPSAATTLLLAHEPDFFDRVVQRQAPVAVQFSGHSHGGQIRLPRLQPGPEGLHSYAPVLPRFGQRYPIGLRRIGAQQVYTNRGLGVWPVPYRLNCKPELTIFTLLPPA